MTEMDAVKTLATIEPLNPAVKWSTWSQPVHGQPLIDSIARVLGSTSLGKWDRSTEHFDKARAAIDATECDLVLHWSPGTGQHSTSKFKEWLADIKGADLLGKVREVHLDSEVLYKQLDRASLAAIHVQYESICHLEGLPQPCWYGMDWITEAARDPGFERKKFTAGTEGGPAAMSWYQIMEPRSMQADAEQTLQHAMITRDINTIVYYVSIGCGYLREWSDSRVWSFNIPDLDIAYQMGQRFGHNWFRRNSLRFGPAPNAVVFYPTLFDGRVPHMLECFKWFCEGTVMGSQSQLRSAKANIKQLDAQSLLDLDGDPTQLDR